MQDGYKTYLLFFAVTQAVQENGHLKDLGVAILECVNASSAKMGCPNDEGRPEHPFWMGGLADIESSVVEVTGSQWLAEIRDQRHRSAKRIWNGRGMNWETSAESSKRFLITLKEATFECLAESLAVVEYAPNFGVAFKYVLSEFKRH